jgi:hypothetical protein
MVAQSLCGLGSTGPYTSKLVKPVLATDTTFQVDSSTPSNEDPVNGPRTLQTVLPGDRVGVNGCHGGEQEIMTIAAVAGTTWTMKRGSGSKAWPTGTRLVMIPNIPSPDLFYDPVADKLAVDPNHGGSHRVVRQPYDVNADYHWRTFTNPTELLTKGWDGGWSWVIPGTEGYPMVQHQRHPSLDAATGMVYDIYSVYQMSVGVTPMSPSMGGLNAWSLKAASVANSVKITGRLFSSPIMPHLSITANVHPIGDSGWVIGMCSNSTAICVASVSSSTPPPPTCDCCDQCPYPVCPVCPPCPPPACDCAALKTQVASQQATITSQQATISNQNTVIAAQEVKNKEQAARIAYLEKLIQDALAILNQWTTRLAFP